MQFSLQSLIGYITLCSLLSACSAIAGVGSSIGLMLLALALWFRQGLLALAMLAATLIAAGAAVDAPRGDFGAGRFLLIVLVATGLCAWYTPRRELSV